MTVEMALKHYKSDSKKIVIIVGGGFGGYNTAKALAGSRHVHVALIDKKNHHLFQPLLYQVASAGLNPSDIAVPIRSEFKNTPNVEVQLGEVLEVNLTEKYLVLDDKHLQFDYIVLACGAEHSYFGHPEWEEFAPGLKTLEQATEVRRRILVAFERAENESDPSEQQAYLTFVIVGAGPTGVELAGAIAEISRTVLIDDFKVINPANAHVVLIEGGDRILAAFPPKLSEQAQRDLSQLGVTVYTSSRVTEISGSGVNIGQSFIPSKNVFWAAGVQARKVNFYPAAPVKPDGRIAVNSNLSIPNFPFAFVIGDMALIESAPGKFLPGVAQVAIQAGRHVARQIMGGTEGVQEMPFKYKDRGMMATIGKNRAIAQIGSLNFSGRFAWLLWLFVHLFSLVGFRNRISVVSEWIWSYMFYKRGARLITDKEWRLVRKDPEECPK